MILQKAFDFKSGQKSLSFLGVVAALFLVGFLIYSRALFFDFVHDDNVAIKNNSISSPNLSLPSLFRASQSNKMVPYYRPFLEAFYQVEIYLFGNKNPFCYHLFNIFLHIVNSIFVFILLKRFSRGDYFSLGAAVLFLIHPVQTEAVAAIAGITNLLYSFFCLSSFILYLKTTEEAPKLRNLLMYAASLFLFFLGMLSKEPAVIFPFLILLYEIIINKGREKLTGVCIIRVSGISLVAIWYLIFRKIFIGSVATPLFNNTGELWLRILAIPQSLLEYFQVIFFPVNLHYFRSIDILNPPFPALFFWVVLAMGIAWAIFQLPKNKRNLSMFGLAWFFVALLPTLNILPLIIEYSHIYVSEHFLYFPLLGTIIFSLTVIENVCSRFLKEKAPQCFGMFFLFIAVVLSAATFKQTVYWKNDITLFNRTLSFEPQIGRVHIVLARSYYLKGDVDRAMKHYGEGLARMEEYVYKANNATAKEFYLGFIKEIHFDLAHCYEAKGDFQSAIGEYKKCLLVDNKDAIVYNNLGVVHLYLNKIEEAKNFFEEALMFDGKNVLAMNNLAICNIKEGNLDKAKSLFEAALRIDPGFVSARSGLEGLLKNISTQ